MMTRLLSIWLEELSTFFSDRDSYFQTCAHFIETARETRTWKYLSFLYKETTDKQVIMVLFINLLPWLSWCAIQGCVCVSVCLHVCLVGVGSNNAAQMQPNLAPSRNGRRMSGYEKCAFRNATEINFCCFRVDNVISAKHLLNFEQTIREGLASLLFCGFFVSYFFPLLHQLLSS